MELFEKPVWEHDRIPGLISNPFKNIKVKSLKPQKKKKSDEASGKTETELLDEF